MFTIKIYYNGKWFSDLGSFDNTTIELDFGFDKPVKCSVELVDVQV